MSKRASALRPAPSPSTRLPLMPAFSTATPGVFRAARRRASTSGQRLLVSVVDRAPSVIESPKATSPIVLAGAITSTRAMRNQAPGRSAAGSVAAPT